MNQVSHNDWQLVPGPATDSFVVCCPVQHCLQHGFAAAQASSLHGPLTVVQQLQGKDATCYFLQHLSKHLSHKT